MYQNFRFDQTYQNYHFVPRFPMNQNYRMYLRNPNCQRYPTTQNYPMFQKNHFVRRYHYFRSVQRYQNFH
jgi:hypothetical protein